MNGGSVEIGRGGNAVPINEPEVVRECLQRSGHSIAARAAQFEEILRPGNGDQEASVVAQDPPEFAGIHPRGDRQDDRERAIGVRHEAISIGHYALATWVASRRGINGRNRNVDTMRIEAGLASKGAEVETVAAAGIKNDVAGRSAHDVRYRPQERFGDAALVQSPAPRDGGRSVARLIRSPVLWLKQVDVPAARDVERMPARTEESLRLAHQRQMTAADGADEHDVEYNGSDAPTL